MCTWLEEAWREAGSPCFTGRGYSRGADNNYKVTQSTFKPAGAFCCEYQRSSYSTGCVNYPACPTRAKNLLQMSTAKIRGDKSMPAIKCLFFLSMPLSSVVRTRPLLSGSPPASGQRLSLIIAPSLRSNSYKTTDKSRGRLSNNTKKRPAAARCCSQPTSTSP